MTIHFKRTFGSAAHAHCGSFEKAKTGIKIDCQIRSKIRRRRNGNFKFRFVRIISAGNNIHLTSHIVVQPKFPVDHQSIFPDGHSVNNRNRMHSDKRSLILFQDRSVHIMRIRIRSVENNQRFVVFRTSLHHIMKRRNVRVETNTHILNIKQNNIYIPQLIRTRFFITSIKGNDR
ncbi:hypothetical protein D3C71_833780 [compost metagenome]